MAILGPAASSRTVQKYVPTRGFRGFGGQALDVYLDEALTQPATIKVFQSSAPDTPGPTIADSRVRLTRDSQVPMFWFPDGVRTLWGKVARGGPKVRLDAFDPAAELAGETPAPSMALVGSYHQPPSPLITTFQSGHGFTNNAGGAGGDDLVDFALGSQSVFSTTDGIATAKTWKRTAMTAVNATGKYPVVWVKIDPFPDLPQMSTGTFQAGSAATETRAPRKAMAGLKLYLGDTNLGNSFQWEMNSGSSMPWLTPGVWHRVTLPWGQSTTSGSPARAAITDCQFRLIDAGAATTVTISGTPTGGSFTLSVNGETTAPIAYNATGAAVVSALEALNTFNPGDLAATAGALPGTAVKLVFYGAFVGAGRPILSASGAGLTGGTSPAVAVVNGESVPPVTVRWNGVGLLSQSTAWPNGVVSFTFDDTYLSHFTEARRYLDKYGFGGTAYVIQEYVGLPGRMTLDHLRQMERTSGWEIAGHATTGAVHNLRLQNLTDEQLDQEFAAQRRFLRENGFRGDHTAYPGGEFDERVLAACNRWMSAGRTVFQRSETLPPARRSKLRSGGYVTSSHTVATLTAAIDQAYANGEWMIFSNHDLVSVIGSTSDQLITDFQQVVDYAYTKGIPVRTVGEVLRTKP